MEKKRSLFESYLFGLGQVVVWLLPSVVVGLTVALAQRAFLPPSSSSASVESRGGKS
jgi:hypothetical protein